MSLGALNEVVSFHWPSSITARQSNNGVRTMDRSKVQTFERSNVRTIKCSNVRRFERSAIQMFERWKVRTFEHLFLRSNKVISFHWPPAITARQSNNGVRTMDRSKVQTFERSNFQMFDLLNGCSNRCTFECSIFRTFHRQKDRTIKR